MNIFWFRWLSLLSLDAVFVALTWQEVLARASHVHLTWQERALLGISVWIIYILDHLLDAASNKNLKCPFRVQASVNMSPSATDCLIATSTSTFDFNCTRSLNGYNQAPRHHFISRHRFFFIGAMTVAFLIDVMLLPHIPFPLLVAGSTLGLITSLYLFFNTSLLTRGIWPCGKETLISLIFTLGCGLVPLVQTHEHTILFFSMMGLLTLNNINCTLIARLERGVDITRLSRYLIPSPVWIIPSGLTLVLVNNLGSHFPIVTAFLISLMGLSLVPSIAKCFGYETASLATDGALVLGGLLSLVR